jgi:hypothetical protein
VNSRSRHEYWLWFCGGSLSRPNLRTAPSTSYRGSLSSYSNSDHEKRRLVSAPAAVVVTVTVTVAVAVVGVGVGVGVDVDVDGDVAGRP